jgi:MSHA biogenesis protein MshQ
MLCKAADLSSNSDDDYLTVNPATMNGLTDFTAVIWGKTTASSDSTVISAASGNSSLGANEAVLVFTDNNQFWPSITASPFDESSRLGSTAAINDGNWHQLAWTRRAASRQSCFYFDGALQGCVSHTDGDDSSALQVISLVLGQDQDSLVGGFDDTQDWEGLLDELLIFNRVLNQNQIVQMRSHIQAGNNWDGTSRNCPAVVDHYQLIHDGQALTCATESVIIKACLNSQCTDDSEIPITMNLNVGNTALAAPTVTGTAVVPFNFTTVGDQLLSLQGISQASTNGVICINTVTGSNSCVMNFAAAGFNITLASGESCLVNNLTIEAVQQSNNSASCAPLYTGNQSVDLTFNYSSPLTGSIIPAVGVEINALTPLSSVGLPQTRSLTFDGDGKASLKLSYNDAGTIGLTANAIGTGPLAGLVLNGTGSATYHPGQLVLTARNGADRLNNASSSGVVTHIAASHFTLDIAAQCSDGTATSNYQPQTVDKIEVLAVRTGPTDDEGGINGGLSVDNQSVVLTNGFTNIKVSPSAFVAGIASVTTNYSEVGLIQLDARDTNYEGQIIDATAINVGRFIPDHFELAE